MKSKAAKLVPAFDIPGRFRWSVTGRDLTKLDAVNGVDLEESGGEEA